MMTLTIYRPPTPTTIATIKIDEKCVYTKKLMGEHQITCEFYYASVIALQIGDYTTYDGESYYINRLPDIVKINDSTFRYKIIFEGVIANLGKKLFLSSDGLADYSYNGTASDILTLIVASINVIDSGWTVGTVDSSDEQTMQFTNESCREALIRVAEAFDMEFSLAAKVISLKNAVGNNTAYTFTYGKEAGLYKLERQQVSDQNIVTKVYGFGSTRNIPLDYRSRAKRLVFEYLGNRYLTKNTDTYGVIEGQFTDDDIYPNRTGTLTAASIDFDRNGTDFNFKTSYVADSSIDFDLNDYLIEGLEAKIVFKTGDLAGVECVIWKYDHANKRIYFNPYSDTDGYTLPFYNGGSTIQPKIGDTYTFIDIELPQSYITTAETALQAATQAYLDENSVPMVVYSVDIDPKYAKDQSLDIDAGDKVTVVDSDLSINALIRISAITFPLVEPYRIKAVIADFVPYTLQERIIKGTISTRKETVFVDRRREEQARRNAVRQRQLQGLLFDTDGYFDEENIKPLSIETMYLAVGAKSQNFRLNGVVIEPNVAGDENAINISAGSLIHFEVSITGLGSTWVMSPAASYDSLTAATAYYLYAKCSQAALTGVWDLSATKKAVDYNDDGNHYFLCGILYPVLTGARDYDFTFGMTYVNGRIITTGRIQSIDGYNYLDLDANAFMLGDDSNNSFDWNVTTANTLTLKGAIFQSPGGASFPAAVFRGAYASGTTYYRGDGVTYNNNSWTYINTTPAAGKTPSEGTYWTQTAAGGTDGANGPSLCYRGVWHIATVYSNSAIKRDVVRYAGLYYAYKGTDGGSGAWDPGKWESVGATFSSVATELLIAEFAYVDNLGVKYFKGNPDGIPYTHGIGIEGGDIYEYSRADHAGTVNINRIGYNGGILYYRDFKVFDGKGNGLLVAFGDSHLVAVYGNFSVNGAVDFTGTFKVPRKDQNWFNAYGTAGMIAYNISDGHYYGFTNVWRRFD